MRADTANINDRNSWLRFAFGVAVWFVHLNLVNALTSLTCQWSWFSFTITGIPGLRFVHVVVSIIAGLALASLMFLSWRDWRAIQADRQHTLERTEANRRPLMAFVTLLLDGLFLLFVLASLMMVIILTPCAGG